MQTSLAKHMSGKKLCLGLDTEAFLILLGAFLVLHGAYLDRVQSGESAWKEQWLGAAIMLAGWKGNTRWVDCVLEDAARKYLGVPLNESTESTRRSESKENQSSQED